MTRGTFAQVLPGGPAWIEDQVQQGDVLVSLASMDVWDQNLVGLIDLISFVEAGSYLRLGTNPCSPGGLLLCFLWLELCRFLMACICAVLIGQPYDSASHQTPIDNVRCTAM